MNDKRESIQTANRPYYRTTSIDAAAPLSTVGRPLVSGRVQFELVGPPDKTIFRFIDDGRIPHLADANRVRALLSAYHFLKRQIQQVRRNGGAR